MSSERKIKVCHVSTVHESDDARIFLKECVSLSEFGYEVFFVIKNPKKEVLQNVQIIPLTKWNNRFFRMLFGIVEAFFKSIKTHSSVYHLHDPELLLIAPWYKLMGKKVIFDCHEHVAAQIETKTWIGPFFLRKMVAGSYNFAQTILVLFCDAVVVVTPEMMPLFPEKKVVLVRNFPHYKLAGNEKGVRNEIPIMIYAGGLSEIRGIKEMLEAIGLLNGKVKLKLMGGWESEKFQAECEKTSGWQYTEYIGYVTMEEVHQHYMQCDAGLLLFLPVKNHLESMPIKSFEYMISGLPIIMSDFPYWRKHFGGAAIFVNPLDIHAIAGAITKLISDSELKKQLSETGLELSKSRTWKNEAETLFALYKKLLSGNKTD